MKKLRNTALTSPGDRRRRSARHNVATLRLRDAVAAKVKWQRRGEVTESQS